MAKKNRVRLTNMANDPGVMQDAETQGAAPAVDEAVTTDVAATTEQAPAQEAAADPAVEAAPPESVAQPVADTQAETLAPALQAPEATPVTTEAPQAPVVEQTVVQEQPAPVVNVSDSSAPVAEQTPAPAVPETTPSAPEVTPTAAEAALAVTAAPVASSTVADFPDLKLNTYSETVQNAVVPVLNSDNKLGATLLTEVLEYARDMHAHTSHNEDSIEFHQNKFERTIHTLLNSDVEDFDKLMRIVLFIIHEKSGNDDAFHPRLMMRGADHMRKSSEDMRRMHYLFTVLTTIADPSTRRHAVKTLDMAKFQAAVLSDKAANRLTGFLSN